MFKRIFLVIIIYKNICFIKFHAAVYSVTIKSPKAVPKTMLMLSLSN
jgi:hypothetical protein